MTKGSELGTIVKSNIIDQVYERIGFTRQEAALAVDVVLDEIKAVLSKGESVRIVGFASFNLREKKARNARNPRTGEPIIIKPRRVLTFKPSKHLLDSTNSNDHETIHS